MNNYRIFITSNDYCRKYPSGATPLWALTDETKHKTCLISMTHLEFIGQKMTMTMISKSHG